jgi:hypothetical protein
LTVIVKNGFYRIQERSHRHHGGRSSSEARKRCPSSGLAAGVNGLSARYEAPGRGPWVVFGCSKWWNIEDLKAFYMRTNLRPTKARRDLLHNEVLQIIRVKPRPKARRTPRARCGSVL